MSDISALMSPVLHEVLVNSGAGFDFSVCGLLPLQQSPNVILVCISNLEENYD